MTGFINIDKEVGASSAREVAVIKRLTGQPCGHMGTLDPMAGGVLPIGIGNACRLFDFFLTKRKTYLATFKFGVDYDTLDTTGKLLSDSDAVPSDTPAKVELVYRTGEREGYFLPYYRFYLELPSMEEEDGLKTYGAFYVPAVRPEYLEGVPVWDGSFN